LVRKLLLILAASYLGGLLVITTTPLLVGGNTASQIAIGPLLFDVLLATYLAIRYLHLKGVLKLGAYFLAYLAIVSVPSGILNPTGIGQSSLSTGTSPVNPFTTNASRDLDRKLRPQLHPHLWRKFAVTVNRILRPRLWRSHGPTPC
jgi:hypothetical protein